jgi:hypothetical protein
MRLLGDGKEMRLPIRSPNLLMILTHQIHSGSPPVINLPECQIKGEEAEYTLGEGVRGRGEK